MDEDLNFNVEVKMSEFVEKLNIPVVRKNTMSKEKTCSQLIYSKYEETNQMLEDLNDIIGDLESDSEAIDNALHEIGNFALEFETYKVLKILLSTGGPADWIEVKIDNDDDVTGMTYHYADWFDHAEMKVDRNSYIWDYAIEIVNSYK